MAMSSATKIEKLLNFWECDKENLALCQDILLYYTNLKEITAATIFLDKLSDRLKQHPQLNRILSQAYMAVGKFAESREILNSIPEDQYHSRAYGVAMCLYFERQFVQAEALLNPLISAHSRELDQQFFVLFARIHYQLGNIDQAVHYTKEALNNSKNEPNAELLGLLAMLTLDQNNLEETKSFYLQALEKDPMQHDALLAGASYLLQIQDFKSSENLCQKGIAKFSNSGRFWLVLSQAQLLGNNLPQAYISIQKASELMAEHIGTWHLKAWCELMLNKIPKARISFEEALKLNRNFADSHGGLAVVSFHEGHQQQAEKLVNTALRLDPQSFAGKYALSLLNRNQGNIKDADKLIQDILGQESHLQGTSHSQLVQMLQV
jgi:tetratricopeptide (TPR) repeat protein